MTEGSGSPEEEDQQGDEEQPTTLRTLKTIKTVAEIALLVAKLLRTL